jgi:SAM-dependent methyltransferase
MLASEGAFPIYPRLASIDNCNFARDTIWSSDSVRYEKSFISEATALEVEPGTYDCLIASHCLEHIANPIRALLEWKRVLRPNGLMLLILPNRDYTFDWRRPITTLEHMRKDHELSTPESDLTHLEEILSLHDLSRDPGAGTYENFRQRCFENLRFRAMHHHVFSPQSAVEILRHADFGIVRQDVSQINIFTLARKGLS